MNPTLAAFLAAALTYGTMDLLWVGVVSHEIYRATLGHLMADEVRWGAVALFYPLYGAGTTYFAVRPALRDGTLGQAARNGALLGLMVYGTYDLTNLVLLKGWTPGISLFDVAWGMTVTTTVASVSFLAGKRFS